VAWRKVESLEARAVLYWLLKFVLLGPWLRALYRPRIEGAENVPRRGAAILASNHLAVADSIFLPLLTRRRIAFLAKQEYFTQRGFKGWAKRMFFGGTGNVPIDRTPGSSAAQAALDTGIRLLNEGKLLGIYPEGTRSPDGRLYKGKTGMARMALEARVPIVPVAMIGTDDINRIGSARWRVKPGVIVVRIGKPLDFSRYYGMAGDRFVERSMTDEVMYALMELSGQEYVDMYAAKAKEDLAKEAARIPDTRAV
jgi:1-acyl-sn-glycerol-3-phosphate acyltransferase